MWELDDVCEAMRREYLLPKPIHATSSFRRAPAPADLPSTVTTIESPHNAQKARGPLLSDFYSACNMGRKASGPAAAAKPNVAKAAATRSRTGCLTCRKRKLKCDETKPRCMNCQKGQRECVPAETTTFRHQQNPSVDEGDEESAAGLDSFYKYKDKYNPNQDLIWVQIPDTLTWKYITNPDAQDSEGETTDLAAPGYQQMATHTLEALSTAATRDSNTQFPSPYPATSDASSHAMFAHYNSTQATYPPYVAKADMSNTLSSVMIDPNLETAIKDLSNQ